MKKKFFFFFAQQLSDALEKFHPGKWELNAGDGAFYGPKIDIKIRDALRRSFQCATIQLDFQLPVKFNLKYRSAEDHDGAERAPSRPVIIHRAILGSLERFIGIVTEHFAGKWCVSCFLGMEGRTLLLTVHLTGRFGCPHGRCWSSPSLRHT
jgi:threonyl-tRNA synthetase